MSNYFDPREFDQSYSAKREALESFKSFIEVLKEIPRDIFQFYKRSYRELIKPRKLEAIKREATPARFTEADPLVVLSLMCERDEYADWLAKSYAIKYAREEAQHAATQALERAKAKATS